VESSVAKQNRIDSTFVSADALLDTVRELAAEFPPSRVASPASSDKIRRTTSRDPYERSCKTGVHAVW